MNITPVKMYENPLAPEGRNGINVYNTEFATNLTVGQLVSAVCLRVGAVLERMSLRRMNDLNKTNSELSELSDALRNLGKLSTDSVLTNDELRDFQSKWSETRAMLIAKYELLGLSIDTVSYKGRMESMDILKKAVNERTQRSQETMIEIKNMINRREVAMSAASNIVRSQGQTKNNTASRMR